MTSRNLLNLGLLAFVAVLISLIIFEPGLEPEPVNPSLTQLKQDDINHIYIQRETDKDVELQKINGVWRMLKPYPVLAHDFRVQTILRLSEAESHSQHELSTMDKQTFGLDNPKATVTFNQRHKILFGANEPLQQRRYVQVENSLHTITDTFYYQVASKVSTFIDHALLEKDSAIVKIELPELVIELKGGKWQAIPQPDNFSADTITGLLNNWRNTQAVEVGAAKPVTTKRVINIYLKDKPQAVSFYIVKNEAGIALVRNDIGLAYNITQDSFDKLTRLADNRPAENTTE